MCEALYPFSELEPERHGNDRIVSLVGPGAARGMQAIVALGSGGAIARWTVDQGGPIVWLDSEGDNWVVASDLAEFAALLPYSPGHIYDICASLQHGNLKRTVQRLGGKKTELALKSAKEDYAEHDKLLVWIDERGISVASDPIALIAGAQQRHTGLQDWISAQS